MAVKGETLKLCMYKTFWQIWSHNKNYGDIFREIIHIWLIKQMYILVNTSSVTYHILHHVVGQRKLSSKFYYIEPCLLICMYVGNMCVFYSAYLVYYVVCLAV